MVIDAQRELVLAEASSWLATPFEMNACLKSVGVDCARLIGASYRAAGFSIPEEFEHWPCQWGLHTKEERLLAILEKFLHAVESPQAGDLAVFRVGWVFSHAALVLNWPTVIHACAFGGSPLVEKARADQWPLARRAVRFFSPFQSKN